MGETAPKNDIILQVKDLRFSFMTYIGEIQAVRGVSFALHRGETLAVVGESGCGKSVTMQSIMKLNPMPPGKLVSGTITYEGTDITNLTPKDMEKYCGKEMSMIFQDPMTSLNPTMMVGRQITEGIMQHERLQIKAAEERALEMMRLVNIPDPERNLGRYPHVFSGGMRQRIMIAIALACRPKILFADEPTTALDVTVQAQILELMNDLKTKLGTAIVLITHDLGVVARMAERVAVMYAGEIVETGLSDDIFYNARHPYTWGLLESVPSLLSNRKERLTSIRGTPPDLFAPPPGCGFAPRCRYCMGICREEKPPEINLGGRHLVSCWLLDSRAPKVQLPDMRRRRGSERNVQ
jgi:oligopeptide transport system ATP-binding protein